MNRAGYFFKFLFLMSLSLNVQVASAEESKGFFTYIYELFSGEEDEQRPSINLLSDEVTIPDECAYEGEGESRALNQEWVEAFSAFRGYVHACRDLMSENPQTVNFYQSKRCLIDIGDHFRALPSQGCRDVLLTVSTNNTTPVGDVFKMVLNGYLENVIITGEPGSEVFNWDNGGEKNDPSFVPYVQHYFSLIGEWYVQTKGAVYKSSSNNPVLSDAQSAFLETEIIRNFWDRLQETAKEWRDTFGTVSQALAVQRAAEETQTKKLFQIFETILSINSKVLDAIFQSEMAADIHEWTEGDSDLAPSPVLAILAGDALSPFFERIRTLTQIYDIACKLKSCDENFYETNQTVWMLRFLYEVGEGEFKVGFSADPDDKRPLTQFLKALYGGRHVMLRTVNKIESVYGVDKLSEIDVKFIPIEEAESENTTQTLAFPHELIPFQNAFAQSHDLIENFDATTDPDKGTAGFFVGDGISDINVGFGKVNMDQHISAVTAVNEQLQILSDSFLAKHNALIENTLSINSSIIALDQMEDELEVQTTNIVNNQYKIDAIRNFIHTQKENFAKTVLRIIENELTNSAETFTEVAGEKIQTVAANSSKLFGTFFDHQNSNHIIPLDTPGTLTRGDLLQIQVSGEYEPTCAVRKYYDDVETARTGPRGFALSFSNGKTKITSTNDYRTDSSYTSASVSVENCYKPGGLFGSLAGATTGLSTAICSNLSAGSRTDRGTTVSNTSSESARSDASFDVGMTLRETPYPTAPAGSLLLVEMDLNETDKWKFKSIRTLKANNSAIIKDGDLDGSRFYLVVNDCDNPGGIGELTLTTRQFRPVGSYIQPFIDKVVFLMEGVEQRTKDLIKNGVLNQSTLALFRKNVEAQGGVELNQIPGNIRLILDSFIDAQFNILEFRSQISDRERELEISKLKLQSLVEHFGQEGEQKFLKVSQRNWRLANMDLDFVNTKGTNRNLYTLNRVLEILDNSLVSYLDFKFDDERRGDITGDISLLTALTFASPFDQIALNITTFMRTLLNNIEDTLNGRPLTPKIMMGLHIPNPDYVKPVGFPDPVYDFPVLDEGRAKQFWNEIKAWKRGKDGARMDLDVLFEDLYAQKGMACYVEAPVIDSFGMYFVPENEGYITDFNDLYRNRNAKFYLKDLSYIPFDRAPKKYNFNNTDWRYMDSAVRMAKSSRDAIRQLSSEFPPNANVESGLGTGRSPFGGFQIGDIPAYRYDSVSDTVTLGDTPLNEVKELFIGFTFAASSNNFHVNLDWMSFCAPGGDYWKTPFRNTTFH